MLLELVGKGAGKGRENAREKTTPARREIGSRTLQ